MRRMVCASALLALGFAGCLDRPVEPLEPRTTKTVTEKLTQDKIEKVDLLLVIDNSGSMADKQAILSSAVPDLVQRLLNPRCLDEDGAPIAAQPRSPLELCPTGSKREFQAVLDVHIGIINSSLGSHGGAVCSQPGADDRAHLLAKDLAGDALPTYEGKGFLAWDPEKKLSPPGESVLDDDAGGGLVPALAEMVRGVGQTGCGYESQLESWYRFLVDPTPYETIAVEGGSIVKTGVDQALLSQRAEFLRPDSMLAIILLSDENDCSIKEHGYNWLASSGGTLPMARSECALDPADPCCKSCAQDPGDCPLDPVCGPDWKNPPVHDAETDTHDLRCFDQKRRFGIDFLYPTDRYVEALSKKAVADADGNVVENPIFAGGRDPSLVFFAGIVGVPWQDIARDPADLTAGFKDSDELEVRNPGGHDAWDIILGDPSKGILPVDPLMHESIAPRSGTSPVTGEPLAPPGSPAGANSVNGHEWTIPGNVDLQYACIFPIPPRDCVAEPDSCDCGVVQGEVVNPDNPLCAPNPADGGRPTLQVRAKAYPGLRELGVLRGLGAQGIVASVCPRQTDTKTKEDYGYQPAVGAIVDRLKQRLLGECLPFALEPDAAGQVSCLLIEARKNEDGGACCDPQKARLDVSPDHQAAVEKALADPAAEALGWNCFCEVPQLRGAELAACRSDPSDQPAVGSDPVDGWCYVDALTSPDGAAEILADCGSTEKRKVRVVGDGEVAAGATLWITCSGE